MNMGFAGTGTNKKGWCLTALDRWDVMSDLWNFKHRNIDGSATFLGLSCWWKSTFFYNQILGYDKWSKCWVWRGSCGKQTGGRHLFPRKRWSKHEWCETGNSTSWHEGVADRHGETKTVNHWGSFRFYGESKKYRPARKHIVTGNLIF